VAWIEKNTPAYFPRRLGRGRDCKEHRDIKQHVMMYHWRLAKGRKNPAKVRRTLSKQLVRDGEENAQQRAVG
jgi:hypothetical protein